MEIKGETPRGMENSTDSKYMYTCRFGEGEVKF